jgi:signal transduction histidine kinase
MKFSEFKKNIDAGLKTSLVEDESVERTKNLEIILNIINSINRSLVLEDVLELVLKNAIRLTNSERGFIVLKTPQGKLEFKLGLDANNKELPEELFQISSSVVEDVFYNGQSRFIEGAQSDAAFVPSKSIVRLDLQTILCSPLITDGQKIGVIYVDSKHLHKIKEKDITNTFEILAGQAASAIRNAQLYNAQIAANKALQEANEQLIKAERKALKSSIDSEIGQSLQALVHLALLEGESLYKMIDDIQKQFEKHPAFKDSIVFDRLKLKAKISNDSIRSIQKYAQILLETSLMNLVKDTGNLNKTIQTVIKYLVPMKKFQLANFKLELTNLPDCSFDSEQIQHVLVLLITNAVEAKKDVTITFKSFSDGAFNYLNIHDDGPGIPKEIKEDITNNFTPRNNSYSLFLCKSVIEKHNGEFKFLEADSGTAIQISLPL